MYTPSSGHYSMGGYVVDTWSPPINKNLAILNNKKNQIQDQFPQTSGMYQNPFGTAMSGTQSGTLQPYVNRNSQMANQALYGGLLGYNPRAIMSGDAGGTPVNSTPPQFNMQSAIPQQGQGLNFTGFGNRSWMGK